MNFKYSLSEKNFDETRRNLLFRTFFIHRLVTVLRQQLSIPRNGFATDKDALEWEKANEIFIDVKSWYSSKTFGKKSKEDLYRKKMEKQTAAKLSILQPIFKSIDKFSFLDLDFDYIKNLVLGRKIDIKAYLDENPRIYTVGVSTNPIFDPGIYIKYTPELSVGDLNKLKKCADKYWRIMQARGILNMQVDHKEKRKSFDFDPDALERYVAIEQTLIELYLSGRNNYTLGNALIAVSGNLKINLPTLRRSYYRVQKKFNLPSIADSSKITT